MFFLIPDASLRRRSKNQPFLITVTSSLYRCLFIYNVNWRDVLSFRDVAYHLKASTFLHVVAKRCQSLLVGTPALGLWIFWGAVMWAAYRQDSPTRGFHLGTHGRPFQAPRTWCVYILLLNWSVCWIAFGRWLSYLRPAANVSSCIPRNCSRACQKTLLSPHMFCDACGTSRA